MQKKGRIILLIVGIFFITISFVSASWTDENSTTIIINSTNYDAYCNKTIGLCDFYNKSGAKLFEKAGDIYVGVWEGRDEFKNTPEKFDENYTLKRDYIVSFSSLVESNNIARVSFSQNSSEIIFNSTYTFYNDSSKVLFNGKIIYLVGKNISNEIIKTGILDAFNETIIDAFDQPTLINSIQKNSLDSTSGLTTSGQASLVLNNDSNYIKEGSGSVKLTFIDDNDGLVDYTAGMTYTFTAVNYTNKTHLSFWIYPLQGMKFRTFLYNSTGSQSATSVYFPANQWSLFQWDFNRSTKFIPSGVYKIIFLAYDNSSDFFPPNATMYIDDIRFSEDIEGGLMSVEAGGFGNDYWRIESPTHTLNGTASIDTTFYNSGGASLRLGPLNFSGADHSFYQFTLNHSSAANPNILTNISDYDFFVFDVFTPCDVDIGFLLNSKYQKFNVPLNKWQTIQWDFKNDYLAGGTVDNSFISYYSFKAFNNANVQNCTLWFDNLRLVKLNGNYLVFDGETNVFNKTGEAVKYSSRIFKINNLTSLFGDNFGASNIEYIKKDIGDKTIGAYITKLGMHTFVTTTNRTGVYTGTNTYYKEVIREEGDIVEGTIVYDFQTSSKTEIIKSKWPRSFDSAYSISEDDFYFNYSKAYYCGTSNDSSPEYCKKGILGHNLLITNNLWAVDTYWDNSEVRTFLDLLYNNGIEIAVHSPSGGDDNRSVVRTVLSRLVNSYNTVQWVDHATNLEDLGRTGAFLTINNTDNTGEEDYYVLDLLKENNFKYIWGVTNPMNGARTSNLFYEDYLDLSPLLHRNSIIDKTSNTSLYLSGRSWGGNSTEFLLINGGGNITDLPRIINEKGLVVVYTHSHSGYSSLVGSEYILDDEYDNVFSWLESKQNEGILWVDSTENIFDWMLELENVTILNRTGDSIFIKNDNNNIVEGVSLDVFENNISSVKIENLYQIYVDESNVVLPQFSANESMIVNFTFGNYNSSLPRLSYVDVHLDVLKADYDESLKKVTVQVINNTKLDIYNKTLTIIYNVTSNFYVYDNNYNFATITNGVISNSNSSYLANYNFSTGIFNFTLPHMSQHEIILQEYITLDSITEETSAGGRIVTHFPSYTDIQDGYKRVFTEKQNIQINLSSHENYTVKIEMINKTQNNITISVGEINYSIAENSSEKIDLNNDGYYDLKVSIIEIYSIGYAKIEFKEIEEEIIREGQVNTIEENKGNEDESIRGSKLEIIYYAFAIIVFFGIIFLLFRKLRK